MRRRPRTTPSAERRLSLESLESRTMLHAGAMLSGSVYFDANGDGVHDATEQVGIPGVVMRLSDTDSSTVRSTITDGNGSYSFDELLPGTYQISKQQSPAMIDGPDSTSIAGAVAGDSLISNILLVDDQELTGIDFGEQGLQPQHVSITWFFGSAPTVSQRLRESVARGEELAGNTELAASIRAGADDVPDETNAAPVATDDGFAVDENSVLTLGAELGVLVNDTDADGDTLTVTLVDSPSNGALSLNADGSLTYTPNADFSGSDSFTYRANDSVATSNVATVQITVNPVNQAPVAVDDAFLVSENSVLALSAEFSVLVNDTDADGDTLTVTLVDSPSNGTASLSADGSLTYTPNADFSGSDSFTYRANDSVATSNLATVRITVSGTNQSPVANDDSFSVSENGVLTIDAAAGVLNNDTDPDSSDTLTTTLVDSPSNGSVIFNSDGSFAYTPNANFSGTDSFTYTISDTVATSNTATVQITVNALNEIPVAANDNYTVNENSVLTANAANGVLVNDTDADNGTLAATLVDAPSNGSVTLNSDGSFTYTPNADFSGSDSFTYLANDGTDNSNVVTVSISIAVVNELFAPVATGSFTDTNLLGIRTDLEAGAPAITSIHTAGSSDEIDYAGYSNPPTYGDHNPVWLSPTGIFLTEQREENLVHNLEHGHVWISYNPTTITASDLALLQQFVLDGTTNSNGSGVGVILTPRPENTTAIALASWAHLLTLDSYNADTIRNFIETNRGHAPEGFITP